MKTSEAQFEAKVEFLPDGEAGIPTAKLVGFSGSYLPAGRLVPRSLQRIKIQI
jgi:hypothetical protein